MKKFKDLQAGDVVYILIMSKDDQWIRHRKVVFALSTPNSSSPGKSMIFFDDEVEPGLSVDPESYMGKKEFESIKINNYYFSDKEYIDYFLKEEKERLYKLISKIDEEHEKIWNEEDVKIWRPKKGDLLFDKTYSEVMVFDGIDTAYNVNCVVVKNVLGRKIEPVDEHQANMFLENVSVLLTASRPSKAIRLKDMLEKCGYLVDKSSGKIVRL